MTTLHPLADPEVGTLDDLVDLDRYPLHQSGLRDELSSEVAARLSSEGIAHLDGFLRPAALPSLADELDGLRRYVTVTQSQRSAYARDDDPSERTSAWIAGHVTRDMLPPHSPAQRIYVAPAFKLFVAACVGRARVFEYADPLAGLVATVLPPGGCYGWHYDTNEFVITIAIRAAEEGGRFEFVPNLRRPGHENLDGLRAVQDGDHRLVRTTTAHVGDLQLFLGRYSLHRVTEVNGTGDRITLVLSYADRPGVIGPPDRTRQVYGRITEAHLVAAEHTPSDGLIR